MEKNSKNKPPKPEDPIRHQKEKDIFNLRTNPNPRANENIPEEEKNDNKGGRKDNSQTEITDGEDG